LLHQLYGSHLHLRPIYLIPGQINKTIIPIQCDITSKDSLASTAANIATQTPFINCLIANAGALGTVTSLPSKTGTESIDEVYNQLWATDKAENVAVMDTNVVSLYYLFVAFLHLLDAGNKHGSSPGKQQHIQSQFLTIGSMGGFVRYGEPGQIYSSSKAAVTYLTKNISTDFAMYGIRANCIAPGLFITEMTESYFDETAATSYGKPGGRPKQVNPSTRSGIPEVVFHCPSPNSLTPY
jgi:NAD(P)-dependent dehydrogenase (short-subunit alcohol dehydrogenase family)